MNVTHRMCEMSSHRISQLPHEVFWPSNTIACMGHGHAPPSPKTTRLRCQPQLSKVFQNAPTSIGTRVSLLMFPTHATTAKWIFWGIKPQNSFPMVHHRSTRALCTAQTVAREEHMIQCRTVTSPHFSRAADRWYDFQNTHVDRELLGMRQRVHVWQDKTFSKYISCRMRIYSSIHPTLTYGIDLNDAPAACH
jgi:hypothetical protein